MAGDQKKKGSKGAKGNPAPSSTANPPKKGGGGGTKKGGTAKKG